MQAKSYPVRHPRCGRRGAAALFCAIAAMSAAQRTFATNQTSVTILISSHGPYREAADQAAATLQELGVSCSVKVLEQSEQDALQAELTRLSQSSQVMVVAGGSALTSAVLRSLKSGAVVSMMTPNAADSDYSSHASPDAARVATVTSDVDPVRQIDWILTTKHDCRRVAVLCSSRTKETVAAIRKAGRARGLEIVSIDARHDQFPAAIDELTRSGVDGVLMIPDSQVYNAPNVQRLLLWGVRQKRPVWAFSSNVVKAGALAGVYSDPAEVGAETARVVKQILDGASPKSIGLRYLDSYGHAVNLHTAEMTDIKFDDDRLGPQVVKFGD